MSAGPGGVPDPIRNNAAASRAMSLNGFSGSSVQPDHHLLELFCPCIAVRSGPADRGRFPSRATSRSVPSGPFRGSVPSNATRRFDRLKFGTIEFGDCPRCFRERAVLLIVRQCVQPFGVLSLERLDRRDGVGPSLDPKTSICLTPRSHNRRSGGSRGASGLAVRRRSLEFHRSIDVACFRSISLRDV